jgi:hypothetical protein
MKYVAYLSLIFMYLIIANISARNMVSCVNDLNLAKGWVFDLLCRVQDPKIKLSQIVCWTNYV